jgi:hypothetical protein
MEAGPRQVERLETGVAGVDQPSCKITVAAIAGAVISGLDREQRPRILGKLPCAWSIVSKQMFAVEGNALRCITMTHGCSPLPELLCAAGSARPDSRENVTSASQKPSR